MSQDMKKKRNFQRNDKNNDQYKKNYGSMQEGHGLAYLQKEEFKEKYLKEKNKNFYIDKESDTKFGNAEERKAYDELPIKKVKLSKFKRAQNSFEDVKQNKTRLIEQKQAKRLEIEEKREIYKQKKFEKFKKLSRKNKYGQPNMGARLDLLVDQIQTTISLEK